MAKVDTHELITPSPPAFAGVDDFAIRTGDAFALVGRVLLAGLFLLNVWPRLTGGVEGFTKYLTSLGVPAPGFFAWVSTAIEVVFGLTIILGAATRYSALVLIIYTLVATFLAHRYWEYQPPQQMTQYFTFLRNLSIVGGFILLFVTGAGRFSVDGWLRKRG
jgi:putative oxidoreductase